MFFDAIINTSVWFAISILLSLLLYFSFSPFCGMFIGGGGGSGRPLRAGFGGRRRVGRVLKPSHLSGRSVALLIAGGDPEDYGRFGGRVDVGGRQMGVTHRTGRLATAVHPHERQLVGVRGYCLLAGARLRRLHRQIHGILGYLSGRQMRRLPRQVRPFGALCYFDGRRGARIAG